MSCLSPPSAARSVVFPRSVLRRWSIVRCLRLVPFDRVDFTCLSAHRLTTDFLRFWFFVGTALFFFIGVFVACPTSPARDRSSSLTRERCWLIYPVPSLVPPPFFCFVFCFLRSRFCSLQVGREDPSWPPRPHRSRGVSLFVPCAPSPRMFWSPPISAGFGHPFVDLPPFETSLGKDFFLWSPKSSAPPWL